MTTIDTIKKCAKKIQRLQKKQDKIFKKVTKALSLKPESPHEALLFDYCYNKYGTTREMEEKLWPKKSLK